MEKGILTEKMEIELSNSLDNLVKLKGILESVDGIAFKMVITIIDNNIAEKIPSPYKETLAVLLIDIFEDKDYNAAAEKAAVFVDGLVDIPGLDDPTEAMVFKGIFTTVAGLFIKPNTI